MVYTVFVLIILHILIAFSSLVFTGYMFLQPSAKKLHISYSLVGLTVLTGTILVITMPSHMVSACFAGLTYLGLVSVGIVSTRHKLATLTHSEI